MAERILAGRPWERSPPRRSRILVATAITAAVLITWIVTVDRMYGMDAGPGTSLGGVGWFLGVWPTMMAAMMLPSVMPTTLVFARVSADRHPRGRSFVPTWMFITGYLAAWTGYGLVAYGIFRGIQSAHIHALSWHADGPLIAGSAIVAAGLYQLSPVKRSCLSHCRSPAQSIRDEWHPGWSGALQMGFAHGAFCIGCCWGLMLILFALGAMSITWMLMVAGLIFAEKVLASGDRLSRAFAFAFVALGIWIAAAPSSVPGLTQPGSPQAMRAMRAMAVHGMNKSTTMQRTHSMRMPKAPSRKMK